VHERGKKSLDENVSPYRRVGDDGGGQGKEPVGRKKNYVEGNSPDEKGLKGRGGK